MNLLLTFARFYLNRTTANAIKLRKAIKAAVAA